jgi:CubicO group peptidase (beta-lactamase class C family)
MDLRPYINAVDSRNLKVEGIIVRQHGEIIASHRWIPEAPRQLYSLSKSFTSIAVGMLVDQGKLSPDTRVLEALDGLVTEPSARLKALTLRHLLTMNRGHEKQQTPRTVAEALAQPLTRDPGTWFFYDNGCTFLASAMVTRVTGKKLRDFLVERLFDPLEIPSPAWDESDDGISLGCTGLHLATSDVAKFAQLLLQKGNWKGGQLVSSAWIGEASRKQVETLDTQTEPDWNAGYGYQFWRCRGGIYRGDGMLGQYAVVIDEKDAIVAINSNEENFREPLYAVWEHILPRL